MFDLLVSYNIKQKLYDTNVVQRDRYYSASKYNIKNTY